MSGQVGESLKENKKISKVEQEAIKHFGKIIVILSETREVELALLARMLYLNPAKLRYWLVKRRLWNDCITVEKRGRRWWVILDGPKKAWLAAVYKIDEPKPIPGVEGGNELFKQMISIGERGNLALFAHKLDDGHILLCSFNGRTKEFFFFIPLEPDEVLVNGEYVYKWDNPKSRRLMVELLELLGFHGELRVLEEGLQIRPVMWGWTFVTIIVVKIGKELLEKVFREGVVEVTGEYRE